MAAHVVADAIELAQFLLAFAAELGHTAFALLQTGAQQAAVSRQAQGELKILVCHRWLTV
ncbi:hypothetical protein D3C78_1851490 [compost metagenome]